MSFKPSLGLQTKLTLTFLALIFIMVAAFLFRALNVYQAEQKRAFELRAVSLAAPLAVSVHTIASSDILLTETSSVLKAVLRQPDVLYVYVYDHSGKILADGREDNPRASPAYGTIPNDPLHLNAARATAILLQYKFPSLLARGNILDVSDPVKLFGGEPGGLEIGFSLAPVQGKIRSARQSTIVWGIVFAIAGVILSALISRRLVGPVTDLVRGTELIASGNLDVQVHPASRDELGRLAESFNHMAASLREHQAALQRKIDEAATLYDVGREIAGQIALEPTLHLIVDRSRGLLQADASLVALRVGTTDTFQMRASSGPVTEALQRLGFELGEGLGGRVVATGTPTTVGDYLAEYPDSPFLERIREEGLRSAVAVPLRAHDTVSGVLYVHSREPHKFRVEDQRLLSALADQAAIAIENAKLYEDVKRHAEELEAKVEERTRELQEASRHKSQFLASMSHELRTPMNAVLGYTELILVGEFGKLNDDLRDALERIQRSGRHLLGLINDVLDLSKIEAGRFTLALGDYSMKQVVQAVFTAVHPLASAKSLPLELVIPSDLPAGWGDERRITQVLLNLIGNAIKFTDSGAVTVRVATQDGKFMVSVADTGPGISEADQQRIFDEFQQGDSSRTRKKGGTGLGLAIAKRIVEMHGGLIGVDSAPGKGSTFWFVLPVRVERGEAIR